MCMSLSNIPMLRGRTGGRALVEFEIRLSGSVEVRAAGQRGDLGPPQTRLALAALAWDASRTVSVDTLIHRIWDENPPAKAREALHTHVSRIRKALQIAGDDAPDVISRTNSYLMSVDPDRVDLRRYASLVDQARSLKDSDGEDEAVRLLDRAASLWGGEPLAGITAYWAGHLRAAIGEKSLAAAMTRAEILMGRGHFADAVPVLLPLVEEHPVAEALVEQLAVALYGSRRVAEATQLLQRTQRRIVHNAGIDAGRRLRRVQQGILAGAPPAALLQHTGAGPRIARPAPRIPDNLPRDVPWVGRRDELRRLTAALAEASGTAAPAVTVEAIDGLGGIGKTALAVHAVHEMRDRFPDGRLYLHLHGQGSERAPLTAAQALTELLRLLDRAPAELPHGLDELISLWRTTVRDRRMVVILDDAVDPAQVRPLLPGASPTAVIVTSRQRLTGLPGVRPISLDVLPREDAVALFGHRLGPLRTTRASEIAQIVRLCDHLPLAIEIIASRLLSRPSWTTADLLKQLTGRNGHLFELRDGERTMAHVFALSYRALTPVQQLVFRRIGLHFESEFGPYAVTALTGLPFEETEHALEELLAHHLISEPSPHRFTIHDLLREYARTLIKKDDENGSEATAEPHIDTEGEARQALQRLVDHYLHVADRADRLAYPFRSRTVVDSGDLAAVPGPEMPDAHAAEQWLITEGPNLLAALDWTRRFGLDRQLSLLVHVLAGFLDVEGYLLTAEPLLRRAAAHWQAVGDGPARARALLDLSTVCAHSGQYEEAHATAREALGISRSLKDSALESESIHQLTIPLWHTGQYALAQTLQERSLNLRLQTFDRLQIARSYNLLGITHLHLDQDHKAIECFLHALAGFTETGDQRGRYRTLNNIAELHQKTGNQDAAERAYREAIDVSRTMGSRGDHATLQMNLASILTALGKAEEALALYGKALPALRSVGDVRGEGIALNGTGRAFQAAGRSEEALPHHIAALAVVRRIRAAGEEATVLHDLGRAEQSTGRLRQAVAHLEESLSISRRIGARSEEARTLRALTRLRRLGGPPHGA
ncbi:tetratricopeptide repeat protein [Streptomyces sp. NPDC058198]|uniref:AfsR/SARP family transcriptional regulator n=2 Tax=unclassified Streptomyces TaxID=2593676 RepID=UPI0036E0D432